MRKTGELFILRTNINSVGSVLDSPVRKYLARAFLRWIHPKLIVGGVLGKLGSSSDVSEHLTPFQSYPDLQPLYDAARSYLEIPQRINLLNTRVEASLIQVACFHSLTS